MALTESGILKEEGGLRRGRILQRYKRFLADVELEDGSVVTAHCTNTGTMKSCWEAGDAALLRTHDDPKRKLPFTWVACRRETAWVGVDTSVPNALAFEAVRRGLLPGVPILGELRREVRYGVENSRVDLWGRDEWGCEWFIEVKNTTLREGSRVSFPDAVSTRGAKHLRELQAVAESGQAAIILFLVQRGDVQGFHAAWQVDSAYAAALERAAAAGVRVLPLQVELEVLPDLQAFDPGCWKLRWRLKGELPWIRETGS